MDRIAHRFGRVEPRRRVRRLVLGLLAGLPRANCWSIAEHAGDATPDGMQHLLSRAVWDHDAVRDDLRGYVLDHLGDEHAVLVVDETGDLKKGTQTVGVQRQYTGTAGRIENAQVAVYLTYATDRGHAFIDRALYLPRSWTDDPDRCAARRRPGGNVVRDEAGTGRADDRTSVGRRHARRRGWPATRCTATTRRCGQCCTSGASVTCWRSPATTRSAPTPGSAVRSISPSHCQRSVWQTRSCGNGSKGHRWYTWAIVDLDDQDVPGQSRLLIRRNRRRGELAFYRCYSPTPVPVGAFVAVAGRRWTVEENFQQGKELAGLDQHQVRRWTSWHRWTVLAMLAPRVPRRHRSSRTRNHNNGRADPIDMQRDPSPVHVSDRPRR